MNATFSPKNQAECDEVNALRNYEAAHKVWMDTSVFADNAKEVTRIKDEARAEYEAAYQQAKDVSL